jgi:glycosyltransferase involved in cell wall biosynthesis
MKKTILTLSDHPLSPSGVGTQTKYVIEALLATGEYKVVSLAGAIKHQNYEPQRTEQWGEDWTIFPVDGYGTADLIRSVIRTEKIDMVWIMTDPRFWGWLWEMNDEIRSVCPLTYYHVWDNYPYPTFNRKHYISNDVVATISKVTDDIVKTVAPEVESQYIPHAVDDSVFKILSEEDNKQNREQVFNGKDADRFVFFWNSRNARRKQSGSLLFWYKDFLDQVGHDKATLIMHTDTKDPNGQDLDAIIAHLELTSGQVLFSRNKISNTDLARYYNLADCSLMVSDAEGFGLSALESLSCGTPIIATMTGGLQEQVFDGQNYFGVGIEPASKAIIGSQQIPWIYEDRLDGKEVTAALLKMYNMSKEERAKLGQLGKKHADDNYGFELFKQRWVDLVGKTIESHGSWETRKNYDRWTLTEVS